MQPTIMQLYDLFFSTALVEGTTKGRCRVAVRRLIRFTGDVPVDSLDSLRISQWQVAMKAESLSSAYVRSSFAACSQVWSWAVAENVLKANPFSAAKKIRADRQEVKTFTADEVTALCDAAASLWRKDPSARLRWYAFLLVCGESALRIGEGLNLRWEDIDLDGEMLHIIYRPDKPGEYWTWGTKGKTDRMVPMSQELMTALYRLREIAPWRYPFLKRCTCTRLQAQIGALPEGTRKLPYVNLHREFRQIKARAQVKSDGCFHKLRKTAVTRWATSGVSMLDAQVVAGHASMRTTRLIYIAVDAAQSAARVRAAIV